jgi:hypothetical protein
MDVPGLDARGPASLEEPSNPGERSNDKLPTSRFSCAIKSTAAAAACAEVSLVAEFPFTECATSAGWGDGLALASGGSHLGIFLVARTRALPYE